MSETKIFISMPIKILEIKNICQKTGKRFELTRCYKRLGFQLEFLKKPYTYMWLKNEKVFYVGESKGNNDKRALSIINAIIGAPHNHGPLKDCLSLRKISFQENDRLRIIIIPTKDKNSSIALESVLILTLEKGKPPCNRR